MARNFGVIATQIWRDPDFRALGGSAQRMYLLLITQADITAAGTLPLTVRRWADMSVDTDRAAITDALAELERERFVILDEDTEELLARTFVKWDGGHSNPKRRPAIMKAALAVSSLPIRQAMRVEFEKLGLPIEGLPDRASDRQSDRGPKGHREGHRKAENAESGETGHGSASSQVNNLSDSQPDNLSDWVSDSPGVVVTSVSTGPQPTTPIPQPTSHNPPPSAGTAVALRDDAATPTTQTLIAEWVENCKKRPPNNVIGQVAKHTRALLEEGFDYVDVRRGLQAWQAKGLHPSTLPSVVNEVVNSGGPAPRRSTTNDRVQAGLDLAQMYAERGE